MALAAVLQQPELYALINGFGEWFQPPVVRDTSAVSILRGLGQTSTAVHLAEEIGAQGYRTAPWALYNRGLVTQHGYWTDTWLSIRAQRSQQARQALADQLIEFERERQVAAASFDYVSATP